MNSVEMTNNPSKNDDVVVPTSSLPQEFSFNSSKNMKLTNHLRRFKFFGGAVMAIVMLVLLATVHSSAGLKAARANAPISLGQTDSDLVLNTKTAPTITLWSQEAETESTDDDEEAEDEVVASSATLLTVVDGSNYAPIWRSIVTRTNRFAVFRRSAVNAGKIDVVLGSWNSLISDFQSQFPTTGEAVGFFVLGDKSITSLYEVVYLPSTSKLTASQILISYGLPVDPKILNAPGLPVANTIVVKNWKDITTTNLIMNAKAAGTVSLWWGDEEESESSDDAPSEEESNEVTVVPDSSANLLAVADGSAYASAWKTLVARTNRFAVFRRNAANPSKLDVRVGTWNALVSDFQSQFPANEESVGFFILGDKTATALYEVVFLPSTSKLTASQVLAAYGLPANPKLLNAPGLPIANTLVVRNLKDITTTNFIMNAKAAGTVSLWWGEEESESSDDDAEEGETNEATPIADSSASLISVADGSPYAAVWRSLVSRASRFAVFRRSATNSQKLDVRLGAWSSTLLDFKSQFPTSEPAVGFFILGDKTSTGLYEVVFNPSASKLTASKVLASFALPVNPKTLNAPGLPVANTLVVKNLYDITTSNLVLNAKAAGTISLWWGKEEESDVEEVETAASEAGSEVADSSAALLAVADGSAYASVWKTLVARTNRFAVFRRNAANPSKLDVRVGTWNALVSDFQSQFPANEESVGFFILGDKTATALYEVVFLPSTSKLTAAQVLAAYGLPANPKLLNAPGLPIANTLVVRNLKDITTTNFIMNAKAAGTVSLWWGEEESESSDDDAEEGEAVAETAESGVQSLWGWSSSSSTSLASDGSAYEDVWAALKAKTNRFVVFRQNAANNKLVDVDSGNWDATFPQFSSLFQATKPQVGYIWLGTPNHEQLYEIVYCPVALRTNPATVMVNFGLPPNPNVLVNSYGLALPNTFVATEKKQVDTGNIIMKAVSGGIIP